MRFKKNNVYIDTLTKKELKYETEDTEYTLFRDIDSGNLVFYKEDDLRYITLKPKTEKEMFDSFYRKLNKQLRGSHQITKPLLKELYYSSGFPKMK